MVGDFAATHGAVVVYPGDIFDDGWRPSKCPPELVNFAIEHLPRGYAIPGQHDLPYHRYEDLHKSAYQTLVAADVLVDLKPGQHLHAGTRTVLHGFPWNCPLTPWEKKTDPQWTRIAVVHKYVWSHGNSYPGAEQESHCGPTAKALAGFDVALFGDNHKGFTYRSKDKTLPTVVNCGGFMRRKSDEKEYHPTMTVVYTDKTVQQIPLLSTDKWIDVADALANDKFVRNGSAEEFVEMLAGVQDVALDFAVAVTQYLKTFKVSDAVRKLILETLE